MVIARANANRRKRHRSAVILPDSGKLDSSRAFNVKHKDLKKSIRIKEKS
jgi:hypothetical protein